MSCSVLRRIWQMLNIMKLTKRDIAAYLAKPAVQHRAVLFFGPDEGQVGLYRKQVLSTLLKNPADAMAVTHLAADKIASDPSILFQALSAMSLLGDAPIIIIDPATDKISSIIKDALSMPECQNFLVLCAGELTPRSSLRMLCEKEKAIATFACYRDEGADLQRFLDQELRQRGIRAERDAVNYLSVHLGNDRAVTMQELQKIETYLGMEKTLRLEDVVRLVGGNDNFSIDELCLALGNGQYGVVSSLTQKLLDEGTNAVTLLRLSARHFERLKSARLLIQQGKNTEEAMDMLKPPVFYKSKPAFKKQLSSLSTEKISRALALLLEAEMHIKRGKEAETSCLHAFTRTCLLSS